MNKRIVIFFRRYTHSLCLSVILLGCVFCLGTIIKAYFQAEHGDIFVLLFVFSIFSLLFGVTAYLLKRELRDLIKYKYIKLK